MKIEPEEKKKGKNRKFGQRKIGKNKKKGVLFKKQEKIGIVRPLDLNVYLN